MLQPVMMVPSAVSSAAPTLKFENGAIGMLAGPSRGGDEIHRRLRCPPSRLRLVRGGQ